MAQVEVKGPSEDEDFDVTSDEANKTDITPTDDSVTKIAVNTDNESTDSEMTDEPTNEMEPTATSDSAAEATASDPGLQQAIDAINNTSSVNSNPESEASSTNDASESQAEESASPEASDDAAEPEEAPETNSDSEDEAVADEANESEADGENETTTADPQTGSAPEENAEAPDPAESTDEEPVTEAEPEVATAPVIPETQEEPASSVEPAESAEPEPTTRVITPDIVTPTNEENVETSDADKPAAVTTPVVSSGGHHFGRDILIAVLILIIAGLGLYCWTLKSEHDNLEAQITQLKADPQAEIQRQVKELLAKVSKLTKLPTDEVPTINTVTDAKAAAKSSVFYANAKNGDKVLLYAKSGQAIIYRPSDNRIIENGSFTVDPNAAQQSSGATSSTKSSSTTPVTSGSNTASQSSSGTGSNLQQ